VNPEHLYIHVPFCVRRCGYCDFAVTATSAAPVAAWLEAVRLELMERSAREGWRAPLQLDTIYVGGGTPSLLGTGAMAQLGAVLRDFAEWNDATVEWTAEANPESFTAELAADWAAAGVNRISLGAQTFHEPALRWMGRLHGATGPGAALQAARSAGFDNVSIDLIFGLPERLGRDWADDLSRAAALQPAHVSLYGLTAEPATPLGRWVAAGRETLADEDRYAAEYLLAVETLGAEGLRAYEVSNFSRPGRESRHNRAYWRHRAYLGVGPGAHSYLPPVRSWNVRDWAEYRQRLAAGRPAEDGHEVLDEDAVALEGIWLGLRSDDGVDAASLSPSQQVLAATWEEAGWSGIADGRLRLTRHGWLLLDRLAVELDAVRS
jgi:oxygen-independent coproporphyrinogen III oxidase